MNPARFTCILLLSAFLPPMARAAQSYEDRFRTGASLSARGDYAGAIEQFQAALRLRPGAPEALSNLGAMYHMAGRYADAVETMNQVLRTSPDLFPAQLILGLDLVRLDRAPEAIPYLKKALNANPSSLEALYGLAAAYIGSNQLQAAAALYESRTRSEPNDVDAWYGLGLSYERLAEAASRRLSHTPGGAALDKQFLSEFLIDRGENRLAEEALREMVALKNEPPSSAAQAAYREARALAGRARSVFLHLVDLAPDAWQSRLFLGDLNRQQRHFPEAISLYETVEKLQPSNPAPVLGLATVYWELGDFDKSEQYIKRVLALNPKSPQATFQLGNIRVRQHRDQEAIPLLEAFLRVQPDSLSAAADLGKAYFHLDRYTEALSYLEKARPIDERGDIHYQLATALRKLGRGAEAQEALRVSQALRERQLEREQRLKGISPPG